MERNTRKQIKKFVKNGGKITSKQAQKSMCREYTVEVKGKYSDYTDSDHINVERFVCFKDAYEFYINDHIIYNDARESNIMKKIVDKGGDYAYENYRLYGVLYVKDVSDGRIMKQSPNFKEVMDFFDIGNKFSSDEKEMIYFYIQNGVPYVDRDRGAMLSLEYGVWDVMETEYKGFNNFPEALKYWKDSIRKEYFLSSF